MFATRKTPSNQDRGNLATGETSIDVECRITDTVLAAKVLRAKSSLMLLQNANDLFFSETASVHLLSPQLENRLTSIAGLLRGAGHIASILDAQRMSAMRAANAASRPVVGRQLWAEFGAL